MARMEYTSTTLVVHLTGWDAVWGLKRRLVVPLAHVRTARADPHAAHDWWKARGLNHADPQAGPIIGTFREKNQRVFWDVHDPGNVVIIELEQEPYASLVLQVDDPAGTVATILNAVAQRRP